MILLLVACGAFRSTLQRHEYRQIHMGVEARLVLYAPDSMRAVTAARAAFRRIAELDAIMSDYRDDSELMELVAQPAGRWVQVSQPLWRVLTVAQEVARRSSGAFDITAGPLVLLWREARRTGRLPDETVLQEARGRTGWRHLQLDSTRRSVRLDRPGMRLDLGGIAKGYAADQALTVLRDHGVSRALVELGGDIAVGAPPPNEGGWEIRLDDPAGAPPVLKLANSAISSSGDAAQFVVIDGIRHSHVVDPRTGRALTHHTAATVISTNALLSDPLATALGVLGPEDGARFLREHYPGVTFYVRQPGNP